MEKDRIVETLHCDNPECNSQILRKFVHFAKKKVMNISGLSKGALSKFLDLGYLNTYQDLYHLDQHRNEIIALEGFGEKSYEKLWSSIEARRWINISKEICVHWNMLQWSALTSPAYLALEKY